MFSSIIRNVTSKGLTSRITAGSSTARSFSLASRLFMPQVTTQAPDFKGMAFLDGNFKEISSADYKGKYLVLFFYPLDFSFLCPAEITEFSDRIKEFDAINTSVVGVSVDSHFSHMAWANTPRKDGGIAGLTFPLLSDLTKTISEDYDVLLKDKGLALRGLFIIDGKGTIKHSNVNDVPVARSVDETLRLVQAFQFVEKHGEICPSTWKPGGKSIKPTIGEFKEYFESEN